jgi:PilZ domain
MKAPFSSNQVKEGPTVESPQTRATSRIRIQIPVFLRGHDARGTEFIELTKTLNISARGACIASMHILRPGQTVHLTIPAPVTASSSMVPSETPPIAAKVCRQQILGDLKVFGLEFLRSLE